MRRTQKQGPQAAGRKASGKRVAQQTAGGGTHRRVPASDRLRAVHGTNGMPLRMGATPMAAAMLREALEAAGVEAFRAALDRVNLGLVSGPYAGRNASIAVRRRSGRQRFCAVPWRGLESCLLGHGLLWRPGRNVPERALLTSRAALTVAQVCWRLANDCKVRDHVQGARVHGQPGLHPPQELGDGFDLSDLALAVVATTLVGDGVRDALRRLKMAGVPKWFGLSPARILWAIYTSREGSRLRPGTARVINRFVGAVPPIPVPPIPIGRRKATQSLVGAYGEEAGEALSRHVQEVVLNWCAADPDAISSLELAQRSGRWSTAALTKVHIWLGPTDRPAHNHADTPW